jgi:LPXTG-motif cell wall-anchored protein
MNKTLGLIFLALGVVILGFGINASYSATEQVVEGVTGKYTQNTMLYILAGIGLIIGGGALVLRSKE